MWQYISTGWKSHVTNRNVIRSNAVAIAQQAQPIAEPFSFYRVHNELTEVSRVLHLPDCVHISNTNCSLL